MKSIEQLKAAAGLSDIAHIIGFKPKSLAYVLYVLPPASRYAQFSIPKSSGGTRDILAPVPQLKLAQRRLCEHLQNCLHDIEAQLTVKSDCILAHGFKRDLSIVTNASIHVGRRWVLNLDLKDFFPSINFGRVRGFFIKNKHFCLQPDAATVLAQIICHDNQLPQGAPTSPVVSNLIAGLLDIRLNKMATQNRCSYTRYADDITFSTNTRDFPQSLAKIDQDGVWTLGNRLHKRIKQSGYAINSKKTRMQFRRSRQEVTGLTVNTEVGIKRERLKNTRAQVDNLVRNGVCHARGNPMQPVGSVSLQGHLAHIAWVKGRYVDHSRSDGHWKREPAYVQTYRKFLDHQTFVASPQPVIICEGKTDNTYFRCSINRIAGAPANLTDKANPTGLAVRLFQFTRTTSWVQRLNGGTGDIKNFIEWYAERMRVLSATKFISPVVLVVDNDSGVKKGGLNSLVKSKTKSAVAIDGSSDFYHVGQNLYLVHTPKSATGGDTMIEDFLPAAVKGQTLGGKTLELDESKFDPKKNYGKVPLAETIVKRQQDKINFDAFLPLLMRVSKALDHFDKSAFKA
ncbi:retron Ec67 family RNA-directed DNA polymerase/endonuclease [Jannaschia marina]|uniref:retron Ec67 family RNA-directed DNA polymerase/endonuclease n=1 Tax=Jannaschia marina TaxID=2741674 RepID=UPI0015C8F01F|nr:retron Ec67 family RNA-directed DNA polymerase/endonuclease [Jannaschia marina]